MRILITIVLMLPLLVNSCKPQGPLTPHDAFQYMKASYKNGDFDAVASMLTDRSIKKIEKTAALFASMDEKQLAAAASYYGLKPDRLKNLSVRDYLSIYSVSGGQNVLGLALERNILGIDRRDSEAVVALDNGMKLRFVKQGPYWKFDMTEF